MRTLTVFSFFLASALLLAIVAGNGNGNGNGNDTTCGEGLGSILTKPLFEEMLKRRNDAACPARGFYTYEALMAAAAAFPEFGTTGDRATRRREVAAFMAQSSHETTRGPFLGPYTWGYCRNEEKCSTEQVYFGRGPMQLKYKQNYQKAGQAKEIGADLVNQPSLVSTDPVVAYKTALWLWMRPQQPPKPALHDLITGRWGVPPVDRCKRWELGYGLVTNIRNGTECGRGRVLPETADRVGFYLRYCDMLGVSPGMHITCSEQAPWV